MVTTRHTTDGDSALYDPPTSSDDSDIPAEPKPNNKRSRSLFFGTKTLRPTKRVRNSIEYIPPSRRRKSPEKELPDEIEETNKDGDNDEDEDTLLSKQLAFEAMNSFLQPRDTSAAPSTESHHKPPSSAASSVKRKRGRPRKHPLPVIPEQTSLSRRALDEIEALAKETLGPLDGHDQQRGEMLDSVESVEIEHQLQRVTESVEINNQLQRDADNNVDHETQQDKEAIREKEIETTQLAQEYDSEWDEEFPPIREQLAQEEDSGLEEEFPPVEKLNMANRPRKQSKPTAQPRLVPEHTRSLPVLRGGDDLVDVDDYQNPEEDEETVWTEEEEEDDEPSRAPADPELFQAPDILDDPYEVEIKGSAISWLRALMGGIDWTGLKNDGNWARTIIEPYRNGTGEETATKEVRDLCGRLYSLKVLLDQAPRTRTASHFQQNKYLRSVQRYLTEDMMQIGKRFAQVEQYLVSNLVGDHKHRHQVRQDLFEYGIPMLVLVLSSAYCLGRRGEGDDADRDYEQPTRFPSSGMFTTTRIQYLVRITGWIKHLSTKLAASHDSSVEEDGRKLNINLLKGRFTQFLAHWEATLQKAATELEHIRNRQAEKRLRDEAIKKAKQDAQRAYLDQMHARDEAIKKARRVAEENEKARKEAFLEGLFPPTSQRHSASSQASSASRVEEWRNKVARPSMQNIQWSREENEWLLQQLRATGPRVSDKQYEEWAVALRKPTVDEVRNQAERMRVAAREVAFERDTVLEWWARVVYDD
ncbi:hypothetical protein B0T20DRAFT_346824 [Sordaria brevicollis]|uniref:Uncharacterized protein n=1 Tax=Sordaria brevicollis TaxID=83679 RepID=A0AAE0PLQ5_SORBR|nr:hypothetical protein B0T20DRAFT_346824 [Sordaria brevicollis]